MKEFLNKAKEMNFNSVVVSPTYVSLAKEILEGTDIKVGSVIGFPLGFEDTESKIASAKSLNEKGVDEFEVVLNISYLKDEKYPHMKEYYTFDFIKGRVKKINAPKNRALIVELPLFKSKEDIMKALVYYKYLFKIYSDEFGKKCQAKSE